VDFDESRVVAAAAGGDERAFRALVELHYDSCLRYATRMLGDRSDAEDAVQEVFVRVYRGLTTYQEQGRFRAWLFRILINQCRNTVAQAATRRSLLVSEDDVAESELATKPEADSSLPVVERALATLPDLLREAFILKYVDGWSYEEMAELTGASTSALKMRVARGKDALRVQLREVYDERS
jgi:RNA polymerase sigma-70 factor, ECF subfamily